MKNKLPLPSSSIITNEFLLDSSNIYLVSSWFIKFTISTKNVLFFSYSLSYPPILQNILSNIEIFIKLAGTNDPIWAKIIEIPQALKIVDFPPILS